MSADLARSNSLADLAARINAAHKAVAGALSSALDHAFIAGELLRASCMVIYE
jgi:hypothetical protein